MNATRHTLVACRVRTATAFWPRAVGLLGRRCLPADEGLLFPACRSIHTWGMRFAIDVVALDADWTVQHCVPQLGPWRLFCAAPPAWAILELAGGALAPSGTQVGDRLLWLPPEPEGG